MSRTASFIRVTYCPGSTITYRVISLANTDDRCPSTNQQRHKPLCPHNYKSRCNARSLILNAKELSHSCHTLLRKRTSRQNHDYILQRHANQELLSSRQNLAEGTDNSARPHLHHSKCKQEHTSFSKPITRRKRISKTTPYIQHATSWALAKTLQRERLNNTTTFYKCASQEHSSSCQDFAQGRESTKPCLHHTTCKHFGSCQNLPKE